MSDLETRIRTILEEDASLAPLVTPMPEQVQRRVRRKQAATTVYASLAVAGVIAVVVVMIGALARDHAGPAPVPASEIPTPTQPVWSPVQERGTSVVSEQTWQDPDDTSVDWIDVKRFRAYGFRGQPNDQIYWQIHLAAQPPLAADLEPGRLIAYGLVLETNGDGVADYLVGIDNDAPVRGDFHVWVTDLATGETDEQIGPPYGLPVEFSRPPSAVWSVFGSSAARRPPT